MSAPPRAWSGHPLWLVGFRPFFLLACAAGVVLPVSWVLLFTGVLDAPPGLSPMAWHAHEMFFGFGFAVLGGFLLTASKNWVSVRGYSGRVLQGLAALWLLERTCLWWGGSWPFWLQRVSQFSFGIALVVLLSWTLLRHRAADTYRDNVLFLVALPTFVAARALLLSNTHFNEGVELSLALFRLAFLVMLERTIPPFMKGATGCVVPRRPWVDWPIKGLGLALVLGPLLPAGVKVVVQVVLATLVLGRLVTWSPHLALRRLEVGVMYVGSAALAAQLLLAASGTVGNGAMDLHVFTFGVMGLIIPAMLVRIGLGHTGRPVVFERRDRLAVWVMVLAFVCRVVAPQLDPEHYRAWLWGAAAGWSSCFALVGVRLAPLLWAERVDGREH